MGERGDVQKDKKRVRYHRGDSILWVEFDDEIGRRSARLIAVRAHTPTRGDDSAVLAVIRERLGEPTMGQDNLADGLRTGPAVWSNAECGVVIEATREEPDWWDPGKGGIIVEARAMLKVAGEATVIREIVEEPSVAVAAAATAPDNPSAPARDLPREDSGESPPEDTIAVAGIGGATHPERLAEYYVEPVYPPPAMRAGIRGTVHLDVIVRSDGTVGDITVVDSTRPGFGFEDAAIAAVGRWRYRPALRDQKPVDVSILVRIDFQ